MEGCVSVLVLYIGPLGVHLDQDTDVLQLVEISSPVECRLAVMRILETDDACNRKEGGRVCVARFKLSTNSRLPIHPI